MLGRKHTSKTGKSLPADWAESLARLLNETYKNQCQRDARYFDVYGQIFPEEFLLVISYLSEKDLALAPVSLFLTCEPGQIADVKKVRETQDNYIELTGLFFDEIFAAEEWHDFEPAWQEVTHKHQAYWYKITRENVNLTLKANELLGADFEDVELD